MDEAKKKMVVDERVSFSWKVTMTFIGAALMLGGIYARSEYNDVRLGEKLLELRSLQIENDQRVNQRLLELKKAQIENQKINNDVQQQNADALQEFVQQMMIQTALSKARLMDRWTAQMEDEDNRKWVKFFMEQLPELDWSRAPDTRETQREQLQYLFNEIDQEFGVQQ